LQKLTDFCEDISRRAAAAYIAIKLRDPAQAERVEATLRREPKENEILLAMFHASAGLVHHFFFKDRTLKRMSPSVFDAKA
jgi:cytochrome b561